MEYNLDAASASATASALVVESPGMVQLGSGVVTVTDQSGVATIPVVRLYGANGTVTVHYQTSPINATPGTDFTPVSGTLTLGPGQWTGSIQVPVLDNPHLNHDTSLTLTIDSPTGGATLGATTIAMVHIQDVNPDNTPPQVAGLTWTGNRRLITSVILQFSEPLDPAHATDPADYHLVLQAGGQAIPISAISYDPSSFTVTLIPQSPIHSGQYVRVEVAGAGRMRSRTWPATSSPGRAACRAPAMPPSSPRGTGCVTSTTTGTG